VEVDVARHRVQADAALDVLDPEVAAGGLRLERAPDTVELEVARRRPEPRLPERAEDADVGRRGVALEIGALGADDPDTDPRRAEAQLPIEIDQLRPSSSTKTSSPRALTFAFSIA